MRKKLVWLFGLICVYGFLFSVNKELAFGFLKMIFVIGICVILFYPFFRYRPFSKKNIRHDISLKKFFLYLLLVAIALGISFYVTVVLRRNLTAPFIPGF